MQMMDIILLVEGSSLSSDDASRELIQLGATLASSSTLDEALQRYIEMDEDFERIGESPSTPRTFEMAIALPSRTPSSMQGLIRELVPGIRPGGQLGAPWDPPMTTNQESAT